MAAHAKISDENAESVGRPIFNKVLRSLLNSDREELVQHFPELQNGMTVELFDEASENVKPLGSPLSIEYSAHTAQSNSHVLFWKVQYKNDVSKVHWKLHLSDNQDAVEVTGFGFDR